MYSRQQFTDLTYMGGTRPCAPMTIIFNSVIQSKYTSLNIKFFVNRAFHVLKTLHVLKTPVYRFDLYGRYRNVRTDNNCFWWYYLELVYKPKYQIWCEWMFHVLKTQVTDLTYIGGTGPCGPMRIIFNNVIQSWSTSLNIKFGMNRTFHVLKNQVTDLTYIGGT